MKIGLIGTTYKVTTLVELEQIYVNKDTIPEFLKSFPSHSPIKALVILSTCNRMEYYFTVKDGQDLDQSAEWLFEHIAAFKKQPVQTVKSILRYVSNGKVIQHLFEVASGVDSMVFGENEILTQVKDAHEHCSTHHETGPILNKIFLTAIATGKRVRSETSVSRGAYSVSSIAVEAIRETFLDYFGRKILIVGTGTMGSRVAKKLSALGHPDTYITNRTQEKADKLAKELDIHSLNYDDMFEQAQDFDIMVCATSSKQYLFYTSHFDNLKKEHYVIDLGLPRNMDPALAEQANINLVTVTGLQEIADKNVQKRKGELSKINVIIEDETDKLMKWAEYREKHVNG